MANKVDVCLLQETHVSSKFTANSWARQWGGQCFWSFGSTHARGVGIWFRNNRNFKIIDISRDADGRLLSISADFHDNYKINIINIYAPCVGRDRNIFLGNILQYILGNLPIIMGGGGTLIV